MANIAHTRRYLYLPSCLVSGVILQRGSSSVLVQCQTFWPLLQSTGMTLLRPPSLAIIRIKGVSVQEVSRLGAGKFIFLQNLQRFNHAAFIREIRVLRYKQYSSSANLLLPPGRELCHGWTALLVANVSSNY